MIRRGIAAHLLCSGYGGTLKGPLRVDPAVHDSAAVGGAKRITLNNELIVPMPGAGNDRTLRAYGFVDIGNVFAESQRIDFGDLRVSVGVGLSWVSPMGPLRLGFANPIRKQSTDRIQRAQFQIGTSF
jgi:outer membrane protein insertion porin family